MRLPSRRTRPLVISPRYKGSSPVTARRVVVLPAPLAPSSVTMAPSGTVRLIPLKHEQNVVVDDLEVLDSEHRRLASRPRPARFRYARAFLVSRQRAAGIHGSSRAEGDSGEATPLVSGGGRESNPPEQGRCSHRF
jgi:hypothetical protein